MRPREFLTLDPRRLRLPPSLGSTVCTVKLQRQIARHGRSLQGMPPLLVYRGTDGELMITDGVTRATRAGETLSGPDSACGSSRQFAVCPFGSLPTVEEKLP